VRSALPIDASERDGPRRDRTNGLTLFGREVDTSVQAMPIVARLAQTADCDSRVAIEWAHEGDPPEPFSMLLEHCMTVEQTAPRKQNAVLWRRVGNPVSPHEMGDGMAMRHRVERAVDLRTLLTENVQ
jgi:hypothetical protein